MKRFQGVKINEPTDVLDGLLFQDFRVVVFDDRVRTFMLSAHHKARSVSPIHFYSNILRIFQDLPFMIPETLRDLLI